MSHSFILVGVLRDGDGLKIIDANKQEHVCTDADGLRETLNKLLEAEELPKTQTSKPQESSRRRARSARVRREVDEFEEKVEKVGDGIGDYVSSEYGETLGRTAGDAVTRGTKGVAGFLRKISRP